MPYRKSEFIGWEITTRIAQAIGISLAARLQKKPGLTINHVLPPFC